MLYVFTTWLPRDDDGGIYLYNSYIKYDLLLLLHLCFVTFRRDVGHPLQTIHKAVSHISDQTIRGKSKCCILNLFDFYLNSGYSFSTVV